uniref:Alpha-conopeptide Im1.6 n=1 Tax=Conus imperialis TaxID=35631 RepID=A0A075IJV7_CONIM|nr:alpha-conopeptide precursor Im1.6 [Conus imperialis]
MGMRMMFTVFLLVVLATAVLPVTLDRAPDGRNAAANAKTARLIAPFIRDYCCPRGPCMVWCG